MQNDQPTVSSRSQADVTMKESYLQTGKIPLGVAMRKGMLSLMCDPWLMVVAHMPGPLGFILRQRYYRRKVAAMGKGVVIDPLVDLPHPQNLYLGDFCYIGRLAQFYCPEGYIKIGKRSHVTSWILGHGGVEIGNYVACAGHILSATDSHQGGYRMSGPMVPMEQRNLKKGKIVIEDDAMVGHFSMVLPGVRIGQGAIVGPHSLVAADVEPWTVVMGSPARPIAKRQPVKFPAPD